MILFAGPSKSVVCVAEPRSDDRIWVLPLLLTVSQAFSMNRLAVSGVKIERRIRICMTLWRLLRRCFCYTTDCKALLSCGDFALGQNHGTTLYCTNLQSSVEIIHFPVSAVRTKGRLDERNLRDSAYEYQLIARLVFLTTAPLEAEATSYPCG
ncbi:hypothetical protein IF1G_04699 [Cordyceps javanica]|uniref:Uncharacterized protein n=1 Tax=Cordyceps javanica TaxID=43265 RepID=A0A545V321_9HYPO|nr:hypothetical protein IF1G_04699 [Cordyceps javanica]